jgi:hypothetical protein
MYAQYMTTYFGPSVLLDLKENGNRWYKLHLPPRYSVIWTPEDMDAVIGGKEKFYLITNGVCKETGHIILNFERLTS